MAAKIRKGDKVIVLNGRDKGRTGEVFEVRPTEGKALVRGVNLVKRHQKQTQAQEGGIISKESPIHLSNIAFVGKDGKADPRGFQDSGGWQEATHRQNAREQRSMAETAYVPRLREQFDKEIRGKLTEQFRYANVMQVPRLDKVVPQHGRRRGPSMTQEGGNRQRPISPLIAGQKPIVTYSRVAIATFKLRENQPIGAKVTLRKTKRCMSPCPT